MQHRRQADRQAERQPHAHNRAAHGDNGSGEVRGAWRGASGQLVVGGWCGGVMGCVWGRKGRGRCRQHKPHARGQRRTHTHTTPSPPTTANAPAPWTVATGRTGAQQPRRCRARLASPSQFAPAARPRATACCAQPHPPRHDEPSPSLPSRHSTPLHFTRHAASPRRHVTPRHATPPRGQQARTSWPWVELRWS